MAKAEAWSKLASATVDTADLANGHWHRHAMYSARLWNYLTSWDAIRVDSAYRVWMKLGRPFLWVRVEDLTDDARGKFVLRSILDFLLHGNYDISQHVLSCASLKFTFAKFASDPTAPERSKLGALLPDMSQPRKSCSESRAPFAWPIADDTKVHRFGGSLIGGSR